MNKLKQDDIVWSFGQPKESRRKRAARNITEIEKALSGSASSGETDGGLTNRVLSTVLTWLNNHTSDVFVIGTSNAPWTLPPELSRAERFDDMYFFDTPDENSRLQIWLIYIKRFLPAADFSAAEIEFLVKNSDGWTGAEIKSCCKRARRGNKKPADYLVTVPIVSKKDPDAIAAMRKWAAGVCLRTDVPGLFGNAGMKVAPITQGRLTLSDLKNKRRLT